MSERLTFPSPAALQSYLPTPVPAPPASAFISYLHGGPDA